MTLYMGARCVQRRGTLHFREAIDRHNEFFVATPPEGCLPPIICPRCHRYFPPFCFKTKRKMNDGQSVRITCICRIIPYLRTYTDCDSIRGICRRTIIMFPALKQSLDHHHHHLIVFFYGVSAHFAGHALHCQCFQTIQFFCELRIRTHA